MISAARVNKTTVSCNDIEIELEGDIGPFAPELTCEDGESEGLYYVTLSVEAPSPAPLPTLRLAWDLPSIDFHYKWNSRCSQKRTLDSGAGTHNRVSSSANSGMPVYSLYNMDGINACTWALSDVVHDTRMGGAYHKGQFFESEIFIYGHSVGVVDRYSVTVRFDFRRKPYYEVLRDVSKYWESLPGLSPCEVPDAAREPLFCSWYIYNLDIDPEDLEEQCRQASEAGFGAVILDDGWQTSQREFGYHNNGDWELCESKLPDFAEHVKRVQELGMKYIVWFSVPFIGVESKAYARFKDMLLPGREGATHFRLDLRFPEARDYLAECYETFVQTYGVDGLKLDFIDVLDGAQPAADLVGKGACDCVSMGKAVCRLLDDVVQRLRRINPEILLEFRQEYTGPAMRPYANIFRAVDCPNSLGDNRIRTLDVRLLCGDTAVHADPITWHRDEPVHSAAMQLKHTLFAVPQMSRRVSELNDDHRDMLNHHLAFIREHGDVLYRGDLSPMHPEMLFPLVTAHNEDKLIAAYYGQMPLSLNGDTPGTVILVNGTYTPEVLLNLQCEMGTVAMTVTDCAGEIVQDEALSLGVGLHRLPVPPAGHVRLQRHSLTA
jgi:alpha-galactosidase